MKRLILLAVALVSIVSWAFAQGGTVTCRGTVIDELGEPLIGATVQAVGTTAAVPTDVDGSFVLKAPSKAKELKITYVGYLPLTVKISKDIGTVKMKADASGRGRHTIQGSHTRNPDCDVGNHGR